MIMAPSMPPPVMEAWSKTGANEMRAREDQAQIVSARAREMTGKVTLDLRVSQQVKKHLGWLHEPHHHQSSPGQTMAVEKDPPEPVYRSAKQIPFELVQHSGIFFEENLYTQALNLLLNILASGSVSPGPVFIPSPPQLAVAATFLVHPSTTTRSKTSEEKEAPSAALRLLRLANTLVGPVTAKFDTAFTFTHFESSRQGNRRRRAAAAAAADDNNNDPAKNENLEDEAKPLNLDLGQSSSVWSRAEDFWHAVGWAFNCSVLHARRWERWRLWLEFMCEVLEDDWNERVRRAEREERDTEGCNGGSTSKQKKRRQHALQESLVFRYIEGESVGLGRNRRILRAIFADGSGGSVNEFREVFHNELKELKRDQGNNVKKREAEVNIDEEQYGDYLTKDDDEEEEEEEADNTNNAKANDNNDTTERPRRPKRTRRGTRNTEQSTSTTTTTQTTAAANSFSIHGGLSLLGGLPSLALRQRLLHLLSIVSESLPQSFIPLEELYHLFVENIRHLPLPIYQAFLSPSALPYFSAAAQTTLCECLLFRLRESAAPDTDEEYLNQTKLEQCFLPYAAGNAGVIDNVRMSIALEALLVLLAESGLLVVTEDLKEAVQEGILARVERAQDEVRRNQIRRHTEDIEWCWLIESGERILFLVNDLLPQADGGSGGDGDGDDDSDGQG